MLRIAVVDDESEMHKILKASFSAQEYEMKSWYQGVVALREIPMAGIDLILLDVNLQDMTGHEVCRALKADARTRRIPVLLLTGEARSLENRVTGLESGAEDYLFKPFSPKVLLARVASLLKSSRRGAR